MAALVGVGQRITDVSGSTALTVPGNAMKAHVSCTGAAVRYYQDGRTPSATTGHPLDARSHLVVSKSELTTVRFFQESASAVLEVTYYDNLDDLTALDS